MTMIRTIDTRTQLPSSGEPVRVVVANDFVFFQVNGLTTLATRRNLNDETIAALADALRPVKADT